MNIASIDRAEELRHAVADALLETKPLRIVGSNSKEFYGREPYGALLTVEGHTGVVTYHPSELVVTARAGTRLAELKQILLEQGQMLAFEPPSFSDTATLGGIMACGLSGPRRAFAGSARDYMLGCRIINGKAEVLSFGGEVIKNVAGYDVSRLMVGAMGTLGLLLEISLKVMPLPVVECTCCLDLPDADARQKMTEFMNRCLPLSGLSYDGELLRVRLSGSEKSVSVAARQIGGEIREADHDYWTILNEQQLPFFQSNCNLWRISLPSAATPLPLDGQWLYDWGGGLRWLLSDEPAEKIFAVTEQAMGHATLFRNGDRSCDVFQPLVDQLQQLNTRVKQAFDPMGLFNPQRLHRDW